MAIASPAEERHSSNEAMVAQARRFKIGARLPFLCECSDPGCNHILLLDPGAWRLACDGAARTYVTAPNHLVQDASLTIRGAEFWVHETLVA